MKLHRTSVVAMTIAVLSACGATPNQSGSDSAPISEPSPVAVHDGIEITDNVRENDGVSDTSGLGIIVYSGRPLAQCVRRVRTGSRIRRETCGSDAFDSMYPSGGIDVGTGTESQTGYGNN